ncbi:MAG: hypothetical protein FJ279_13270 [Planctomycetes bacterium]|nr:hypothetical protein [Planctomycetota bacterium]
MVVPHERMNEMKRHLLVAVLLSVTVNSALAEETKRKPENLTMTLAWIADAGEPRQYVFVIGGVTAYRTVEGLKKRLKDLPKGSTLTWDPGCVRNGGEPLLGSQEEMKKFKEFCESIGIKFVLVPSG